MTADLAAANSLRAPSKSLELLSYFAFALIFMLLYDKHYTTPSTPLISHGVMTATFFTSSM